MSQELCWGLLCDFRCPSAWVVFHYLHQYSIREMVQKWNSWVLNRHLYGYQHLRVLCCHFSVLESSKLASYIHILFFFAAFWLFDTEYTYGNAWHHINAYRGCLEETNRYLLGMAGEKNQAMLTSPVLSTKLVLHSSQA